MPGSITPDDGASRSGLRLIVAHWAVRHLRATAELARAIEIGSSALATCERVLGPDHPNTLTARERVLGEEHPISRTVRINLVRRLHKTQRRTNPERRVTAAPGRHGD